MDERVEDRLKELVVERRFLKIKPAEIGDDDNLMTDHGIDSLQVLEIVVGLEEEYDVSLEDDEFDIEVFQTTRSIADYVRAKTARSDETLLAGEPANHTRSQ